MRRSNRAATYILAAATLGAACGCSAPRVLWSQRVQLNGRDFRFARIDSVREASAGHSIEYKDGDFLVAGKGPIAVNGFEIQADGPSVILANQTVRLGPSDTVVFKKDMTWTVESPEGAPAPAEPVAPAAPGASSPAEPAPAGGPGTGK